MFSSALFAEDGKHRFGECAGLYWKCGTGRKKSTKEMRYKVEN